MVDEQRLLAERYVVGDLIGRGGMADVYQGTDTRLGRTVAIKLLKADLAQDPAFRQRFRAEAQSASRMAHPTIVRVYDAGEESAVDADGHRVLQPFIVMEYVRGRTLKSVISEGPIDPARAVTIASRILTALEYSHRAGVVHRDIKPGNIMLGADDAVKVMDFGIARAVSDSSSTVAQTTAILGTASYFSPEQAKGETVDARTDLYSTGVVLFELLTGRAPFRGDTAVAVAYQHVSEVAIRPSELNPAVSPALDAVVARALAKNRDARYQSAAEFRDELEAAGRGIVPSPHSTEDAATALFGAPVSEPNATEQALRQLVADDSVVRTQRRPPVVWIWAGITVVAVILVAVMVWVMSFSADSARADQREVPTLVGMTQDNAERTLTGLDLVPRVLTEPSDTVDSGLVLRADPEAGTTVPKESVVTLHVSSGASTVAVPDLRNMTEEQAAAALAESGLELGARNQVHSQSVAAGIILDSIPPRGERVAEGARVDVNVSDGLVQIDDLVGQELTYAQDTLSALGLAVKGLPDASCAAVEPKIVISQSAAAGTVGQGSEISLGYCVGAANQQPSTVTPVAPDSVDGDGDGEGE